MSEAFDSFRSDLDHVFKPAAAKPAEAHVTRGALAELIAVHRQKLAEYERVKPDCRTCIHFTLQTTRCAKWEDKVPADFQSVGCDQWLWDCIPF